MENVEMQQITVFCSISAGELKKISSWLVPSLIKQKNISKINLYLINYTGNGVLYEGNKQQGIVNIEEISNGLSLGFGEAHNFAFAAIKPVRFFLIINPDVYLHENCISEMINKMNSNKKIGIVEARQLPFEHPKEYNRKTGETPWASGFGILVRSDFFEKVRGFDENFWMYCEDVDLSWRAWIAGYLVVYNPKAVAYHFTGGHFEYSSDRFYLEQFWCARNFIYLMYKFWGSRGEDIARKMFFDVKYPKYFEIEVLRALDNMKKNISDKFYIENKDRISLLKNKIKVIGFNQYHKID